MTTFEHPHSHTAPPLTLPLSPKQVEGRGNQGSAT